MSKKMSSLLIIGGIVLFLVVSLVSTWIAAYNGAVTKSNLINEKEQAIYSSYSNRYDKVNAYISAIESANNQINQQITAITDARTAFADAISAGNLDVASDASSTIESTFIDLISYMEDNPSDWNTVGLTSGFMSEFSATTNMVTYSINSYNKAVNEYNTFISIFPNNIFTNGFNTNNNFYTAPDFNQVLPQFS